MLHKGFYPYENMINEWENCNETTLSKKKTVFYSHFNMEDITDEDYDVTKRVCKDFKNKKFTRTLWFICSRRYIIVNSCMWEL